MSVICPTSAEILALHDEDLLNLGPQSRGKKQQKLLERNIDVLLDCKLTFASQDDRRGELKIVSWNGSTKLCGTCPFCNLVADGLQRGSHYDLHNRDWALYQPLDVEYTKAVGVQIQLKKLEYHKDPSPWLVDGRSTSTWDVHLVLIRAVATLSADIAVGESCEEINVDVGFEIFGDEDHPVSEELGIHRLPLEPSALSENNLKRIRSWVETCSESHTGCLTDMDANFFPARLLQIGNPESEHGLRLVESAGTFMSGLDESAPRKYMALSYCWPTPDDTRELLTTTQETLPERMLDIAMNSLPKAFGDAVRLAQALEIQYIWIDSLCIIQGDERDWQIESSKMAEIFSNAYLTVIAAGGDSCHVGFLEREKTLPSCSVPFPGSNSTSAGGSFHLRYRRHWGTDKMAEIRDGRWITRSWTYQEERLARRVLMFGENKFFFDCRTIERIEDTHRCKPRPDWVDTIREKKTDDDFDPPSRSNTGQIYKRRTPYNHWQTLCNHYSRRSLTYADDKLPAISGMAKQIAKRVGSDYLAGLWRDHLLQDLFWHIVESGKRPDNYRTPHCHYRAPTWSWASVEGSVSWLDLRFFSASESEVYCEILDARTDFAGLNPYGAVVGGYIKVSGKVIEVEIARHNASIAAAQSPWVIQFGGSTVATIRPDITGLESGIDVGKKYHALLIANWKLKEARSPMPRGLLLETTDASRSDGIDEFERIGLFTLFPDGATGQHFPLFAWTSSETKIIAII